MRRFPIAVALTAVGLVGHGVAQGLCSMPRILSTGYPRGSLSYVYTPGVEPGPTGSSISSELEAFFWALGSGHPLHDEGNDSGTFVALAGGGVRPGWVQRPLGYPATFHTTWAARREIDGCVESETAPTHRCSAVLLSDQRGAHSFFAALTAAPTNGNYSFAQPGNGPITLSPIATPVVLQTTSAGAGLVSVTVRVDTPSGGLYLDPACPTSIVTGYRVYEHAVSRGAPHPADLRRHPPGGTTVWNLSDGGESLTGAPIALGTSTAVTAACNPDEDLYLASSLVFDSGFETAHLSPITSGIECAE